MPGRRVFLFANGDCHDPGFYRRQINPEDRVICVDGGSRHVLALSLIHISAIKKVKKSAKGAAAQIPVKPKGRGKRRINGI